MYFCDLIQFAFLEILELISVACLASAMRRLRLECRLSILPVGECSESDMLIRARHSLCVAKYRGKI